ncbi:hypothetical protein T03_13922, partial [Trichinella britovi]
MVLNGTGLTIVLDTRQSSAVISDSSDHQSVYHQKLQFLTHLEERENVLNPALIDPVLTFSTSCK